MAEDRILTFLDYRDEPFDALEQSGLPYGDWLRAEYRAWQNREAPEVPDSPATVVLAFVDTGRWLWQCGDCGSAYPVEPGEFSICAICGDDWVRVELPATRADIEAELLRQPGRRIFSPIRDWAPGQTLEDLRARTAKADALRAKGVSRIRSLSIGATRTWVVGEVLTAGNKNTHETAVLRDLAGRNGRIDLEDAVQVKDGTGHDTQPFLDLDQNYIGLPQRTSDPAGASGRMSFRTNLNRIRAYISGSWRSIPYAPVPVNEGGTGATTASNARSNLGVGSVATLDITELADEAAYDALGSPDADTVYWWEE